MNLQKLVQTLRSTGLPVAYSHFTDPPPPPFLCYLVAYSSNFFADDRVHKKIDQVQVELYTIKKDPAVEQLVQTALTDAGFVFETTETYVESEKLFQIIYEVGVM